MIPHHLNLLSPDKCKNLKRMMCFQFIKTTLEIVLIFLSFSGMILMGGQLLLEDYFNKIIAQVVASSNRYYSTNKEIREINATLEKISKIQNEFIPWTITMKNIVDVMPEKTTLNSLVIDSANKKIALGGLAATREDFLNFKDSLNKLGVFQLMDIPPAQLTEKTDVMFSFSLNLK